MEVTSKISCPSITFTDNTLQGYGLDSLTYPCLPEPNHTGATFGYEEEGNKDGWAGSFVRITVSKTPVGFPSPTFTSITVTSDTRNEVISFLFALCPPQHSRSDVFDCPAYQPLTRLFGLYNHHCCELSFHG